MISNLSLLFLALAKAALYTGIGPGIVALALWPRAHRWWVGTHPIGAKFGAMMRRRKDFASSGRAVSPKSDGLVSLATPIRATSPPRKQRRYA